MHAYMLQSFTTLAVHTHVHQKKRILEVGCGSGLHSLYLAKTMLQRGSVMCCTDISEEMIKLTKNKFESAESEYLVIPGNKMQIEVSELPPSFDLEAHLKT